MTELSLCAKHLNTPSHASYYKHVGTTVSPSIQVKKLRARQVGYLLKDIAGKWSWLGIWLRGSALSTLRLRPGSNPLAVGTWADELTFLFPQLGNGNNHMSHKGETGEQNEERRWTCQASAWHMGGLGGTHSLAFLLDGSLGGSRALCLPLRCSAVGHPGLQPGRL